MKDLRFLHNVVAAAAAAAAADDASEHDGSFGSEIVICIDNLYSAGGLGIIVNA